MFPAEMRFKRQYKPVGFGDPHDARSVEGKRRSRIQAAETRRRKSYPKRWEGRDTGIKVLGWCASAISLRGVQIGVRTYSFIDCAEARDDNRRRELFQKRRE